MCLTWLVLSGCWSLSFSLSEPISCCINPLDNMKVFILRGEWFNVHPKVDVGMRLSHSWTLAQTDSLLSLAWCVVPHSVQLSKVLVCQQEVDYFGESCLASLVRISSLAHATLLWFVVHLAIKARRVCK